MNTYVRQEAWFTIHSTNADQKVQNYFQVFRPAICKCGPHVLHLRPGQLVAILGAGNTTRISVKAVYYAAKWSHHAISGSNFFTWSFHLSHSSEEWSPLSTNLHINNITVMDHITFQSTTDYTYNGSPRRSHGSQKFLLSSDVMS